MSSPRAFAARWLRRSCGVAGLLDAQVAGPSVGDHCRPGATLSVMNACNVLAEPSGMTRIRQRPNPLGDSLLPRRRPVPSCPWPARRPVRPPRRRCRSRLPRPARTAAPDRDGSAPNAAGAASPTRSGTSRSAVSAAGRARRRRPWRWRTPSTHETRPSAACASDRRPCRPLPRCGASTRRTRSAVRHPPPTDAPAVVADETVRPAQPRQVVPAVLIRAEPRQHLADRPRIVSAALEPYHQPNLLRLSGDP